MKSSIKFLAVIALFFTVNFTAFAQQRGEPLDPEQMAEKQTAQMVEKLDLDEAQASKVKEINLIYAKRMQEAHEDNRDNREAMKEIRTAIESEKSADLSLILTDDQLKAYQDMEQNRGKRGGARKGGNRRGGE